MNSIMRRRPALRGRILLTAIGVTVLIAAAGALWAYAHLRSSLPLLDGARTLPGLDQPVVVTRDALGIPTVRGGSRADVARATGFLHAQDRFFQMDLGRRRAAGELSALVGAAALAVDIEARRHRFRATAGEALAQMPPDERGLLEAYADGVNAGLSALGTAPFEYRLLRASPEMWRAEDSLLVVLSMFMTLQDGSGTYESTLGTMRDVLPAGMFDFIASRGTEWDAPIAGARFSVPEIPGPDVYDLRSRRAGKQTPLPRSLIATQVETQPATPLADAAGLAARLLGSSPVLGTGRWRSEGGGDGIGSNNWAVSGRLTDGGALVANDMHLVVRVPNTWYRAALEWSAADRSERQRAIGLTLPGVPALVVGSNTHVAWGFTNTYADWSDIILLELDPRDPTRYRTPDGTRPFERHDETIAIAGQQPHYEPVLWTIWGPVLPPDHRNRVRAFRWVAHSAERLTEAGTALEAARTLDELFDAANGLGAPGQNIVAADRSGRIGWSIFGSIPRRAGIDGRLPGSWLDASRGWRGWLEDPEYPRIIDPPEGRIWTANQRVIDGEMLEKLGDGSYEVGSRATIIRDRLRSRERFSAADMLSMQLDARGMFLSRWRDLILRTLTPQAVAGRPARAAFRGLVERTWTGEASPESVAYRLTRMFREQVSERVMGFVLVECYESDASFDHTTLRRREGPVWKLLTERPLHLLDPEFPSWDALLTTAVDGVIARLAPEGELSGRTWAEYNVTQYRHPLSASIPVFGRWLDMPRRPLAGDLFTPRLQWGAQAASMRMVVSPGREAAGIMQMPTGQSGHPLSPFYANSHEAWMRGEQTPFLPGEPVHTLTLMP